MARVKRGVIARGRHKKVLDKAKGYYGARRKTYRVAKQAVIKAGQYAYRDRRNRKRAELALAVAAVAVGVLAGLDDRLLRHPVGLAPGAVITLRLVEHLLVPTAGDDASFDSCHGPALLSCTAACDARPVRRRRLPEVCDEDGAYAWCSSSSGYG